jgi:hypothetical protein
MEWLSFIYGAMFMVLFPLPVIFLWMRHAAGEGSTDPSTKKRKKAFSSWVFQYCSVNEDATKVTCNQCVAYWTRAPNAAHFRSDTIARHLLNAHGLSEATAQKEIAEESATKGIGEFGVQPIDPSASKDEPSTTKSIVTAMVPPSTQAFWTKLLVLALCMSITPFSLFKRTEPVNTPGHTIVGATMWGLRPWINLLQPAYHLPDRNSLFNTLRTLYDQDKRWLMERLTQVKYVSLCSDAWTGDNNVAMRTVFLSGFDHVRRTWHSFYIATRVLHRHTADEIASFYLAILEEFGVAIGRVVLFVGDGAERAGAVTAKIAYMWCAAHVLNLVVQWAFNTEGTQEKAFVDRCAAVVSVFRPSPLATAVMLNLSDEDHESLKMRATTRWGSIVAMLHSLCANENAIRDYFRQTRKECAMDQADWVILPSVIALLAPIAALTTAMSAVKYPTAVQLLPYLWYLYGSLRRANTATLFATECRDRLTRELFRYLSHEDFHCAKRLALFWAIRPGGFVRVTQWWNWCFAELQPNEMPPGLTSIEAFTFLMESEACRLIVALDIQLPQQSATQLRVAPVGTSLDAILGLPTAGNISLDPLSRNVLQEVRAWHCASASMTTEEDTTAFWQRQPNITAYPCVAELAAYAISHCLTSVCCESLFSAAGFASSGRRNRIEEKRLDMQLFEHWNRSFGVGTTVTK